MCVLDGQSEEIALEQEAGDLTSAVAEQFRQAHGAACQRIDGGRRVAFHEQSFAGRQIDGRSDCLEAAELLALEDSAQRDLAHRACEARMVLLQLRLNFTDRGRHGSSSFVSQIKAAAHLIGAHERR